MGAHSFASDHVMPRRAAMPLMRTVERPTRTRSCGNDLSTLTGEFGDSSPVSKPPGSVVTAPSKSHIAVAAAPCGGGVYGGLEVRVGGAGVRREDASSAIRTRCLCGRAPPRGRRRPVGRRARARGARSLLAAAGRCLRCARSAPASPWRASRGCGRQSASPAQSRSGPAGRRRGQRCCPGAGRRGRSPVSYTHLRAHETLMNL
eukprot:7376241-Prymnesium_polylepis.1